MTLINMLSGKSIMSLTASKKPKQYGENEFLKTQKHGLNVILWEGTPRETTSAKRATKNGENMINIANNKVIF